MGQAELERLNAIRKIREKEWEIFVESVLESVSALPLEAQGEALKRATISKVHDSTQESEVFNALRTILPNLSITAQWSAIYLGQQMRDSWNRASIMAEIAAELPKITNEQRGFLTKQILAEAQHLSPTSDIDLREKLHISEPDDLQLRILTSVLPYMPQNLYPEALRLARSIKDINVKTKAFIALSPYNTAENGTLLLQEALTDVLSHPVGAANAVVTLLPYLTSDQQRTAIHKTIDAVFRALQWALYDIYGRRRQIEILAHYLTPEMLQEILATLRKEKWRDDVLEIALQELARYLPANLHNEAVLIARTIQDSRKRINAFAVLMLHINEEHMHSAIFREALLEVRKIKGEDNRASSLVSLTPFISEKGYRQIIEKALELAQGMRKSQARSAALAEIVKWIRNEDRASVLNKVITLTHGISDPKDRSMTLQAILAIMRPEERELILKEALATARKNRQEFVQALMLLRLAKYWPEMQQEIILREILTVSRKIKDEKQKAALVSELKLVPHLPPSFQENIGIILGSKR